MFSNIFLIVPNILCFISLFNHEFKREDYYFLFLSIFISSLYNISIKRKGYSGISFSDDFHELIFTCEKSMIIACYYYIIKALYMQPELFNTQVLNFLQFSLYFTFIEESNIIYKGLYSQDYINLGRTGFFIIHSLSRFTLFALLIRILSEDFILNASRVS